jgi:hypothetical protein
VLLLAFRALRVPGVARDLRYFPEPLLEKSDPLPSPWSWIAARFANMIHAYARLEEQRDPHLLRLREAFAAFCLERLKNEEGDPAKPLIEGDPNWRQCLIQAVRELRVNPRGRGHQILHVVAKSDPDPEVRQDARVAYDELRRETLLAPGSSPRRAIFAAFWWLRQAQLLALGIKPDEKGAQRTRQRETRRTKEIEEADRVPSQTP